MRLLFAACFVLATTLVPPASAQAPATVAVPQDPEAAREAVQVVDAFMASLVAGELERARAHMAPGAVVIANGHAFGLRDDYIDGAAKGDARALRSVRRELVRRDVRASAGAAWIVSEKRLRPATATGDTGPSERVMETMLLAKTADGWKITHVHWSGRKG